MAISVCNTDSTTTKSGRLNVVKLFLSALIPLMIGLFTVITAIQQQQLSFLQREQDKRDALLLRQQSDLQADHLHKEKVFATYLDDVARLFTQDNDRNTLMKIRAKTLASLRQLDTGRKLHLLLFLYDIELINHFPEKAISSMLKVDEADFNGVHFRGTLHTSCSLTHLYLHKVYLSNASFINCFLDHADFSHAVMLRTVFTSTRFLRTSFRFALLDGADFQRATFFETSFTGASLMESNFTDASWNNGPVDFTGANLKGASISDQQLAKSVLYNSMLPNGTWGPVLGTNLVVNGDAELHTTDDTNLTGWRVSAPGKLSCIEYSEQKSNSSFGKYHFRVTPSYTLIHSISMSQNISLDKFVLLISAGIARYNMSLVSRCSGNQYGIIELTFVDLNGLTYSPLYRYITLKMQIERVTISRMFNHEMRSVQLKIILVKDPAYKSANATAEENYCTLDNVEFLIVRTE